MKKGIKILGILAVVAGTGLTGQAVFANCVEASSQVYEVRQCGNSTWFAPPPASAGTVSLLWWGIGYGNSGATGQEPSTITGSGWLNTPTATGTFIGIDNGTLTATDLDLVDATTIGGIGAPPGSLCLSSRANWGSPGEDSCIDVNRTSTAGGAISSLSDNMLNPYFDPGIGPYYLYYSAQLDPPMGVLLKESNNLSFALAFFASQNRNKDFTDLNFGEYRMGEIVNGLPSSTGNNVVPWQTIPQPTISAVLTVPSDPNSNRALTVSWTPINIISDNSTRPCFQTAPSPAPACTSMAPGVTGVGVNDQGPLVHYDLENTTLTGGVCGTTWTKIASVNHPASTLNAVTGPNTCVRLTSRFGRNSCGTGNITDCFGTVAALAANRLKAQTGQFGDLGFAVNSGSTQVGGPTVSQNAVLTVAEKNKNMVTVKWDTTAEVNVSGFDIVGLDGKGNKKVVASSVVCKMCNNGLGASYFELIPGNKFEGSRKVQIVMQPSGTTSNTLDLK